jgi:hypothetical protein
MPKRASSHDERKGRSFTIILRLAPVRRNGSSSARIFAKLQTDMDTGSAWRWGGRACYVGAPEGSAMRFGPSHKRPVLLGALALIAIASGSCDSHKGQEARVDPNLFPTDYKSKIFAFLQKYLTDRSSFSGASISPPMLKPFGTEDRYVVCVRLSGNKPGERMAIFYGGQLNQFVDAGDVCKGAAYEPFPELERR